MDGRLQRLKAIESSIIHKGKSNVAYLGNIPDGVNDELIESLLIACGNLEGWRRMLDPNSAPKSFGFATFLDTDSICRALWILNNLPILGPKLLIFKVDKMVIEYLQEYERMVNNSGMLFFVEEIYFSSIDGCINILKSHNILSSIEHLRELKKSPNHFSFLNPLPKKEDTISTPISDVNLLSRDFLFSCIKSMEDDWLREENEIISRIEKHKQASIDRRERFERNFQNDFEKYSNFDERKLASLLDVIIDNGVGDDGCPLFYKDRAGWRKMRENELRKEHQYDAEDILREEELLGSLINNGNNLIDLSSKVSSSQISIKFVSSSSSTSSLTSTSSTTKIVDDLTHKNIKRSELKSFIGANESTDRLQRIEALIHKIPSIYDELLNIQMKNGAPLSESQKDFFYHLTEKYLLLFGFHKEISNDLLESSSNLGGIQNFYDILLNNFKQSSSSSLSTYMDERKHIEILSSILWRIRIFLDESITNGI